MNNMKPAQAYWVVCSLLHLMSLLSLAGCSSAVPNGGRPAFIEDLPEAQSSDEFLNVSNGERDTRDQFSSAVHVTLGADEECSGALIHPRLVLTAGHCVCRGRIDNTTTIIDSSSCEKTATVNTGERHDVFKAYSGAVRPYQGLKIVLKKKKLLLPPNARANHAIIEAGKRYVLVDVVSESHADLALIVLEQPVGSQIIPIPLARTDIKVKDLIVAAGYGADVVENGLVAFSDPKPVRRFGRNTVVKTDGELFMIKVPGALALPGDSGGPCFREEPVGFTLVGINSRSAPGKQSMFTSTYRYRRWLEEEIRRVDSSNSDSHKP